MMIWNPLVPRCVKIANPKKLQRSIPVKIAMFILAFIFASPPFDLWISLLRIIDLIINRKL